MPLLPLRKNNSETSEMGTQILFGEVFHILIEETKWLYIKILTDRYEGWVNRNSVSSLNEYNYNLILNNSTIVLSQTLTKVFSENYQSDFWLPAGSIISGLATNDNCFNINGEIFRFYNKPERIIKPDRISLVESAKKFLNSPYLWGGKTILGIDCSGFTQLVMKINGIDIPRDARQQVEKGFTINFISESRPGDLAFFDNEEGEIIHTGIILNKDTIIHASNRVQIDRFDHQGIFNVKLNQYTHKLRVIKSFIDY